MTHLPPALQFEAIDATARVVVANYKGCFSVNAAAIALPNFIVVVDSLYYPPQGRAFREYVEAKYQIPVKYLFLTHYHGDHVFGMAPFRDVDVVGSKALVQNMRKRIKERWNEEAFESWKEEEPELANVIDQIEVWIPNIDFGSSYTILDGDSSVELHHSGGHTGCSAWAYFPAERVLITGDDLASYDWPYISDATGNPDKWIAAFEKMLALEIDAVVPGHGPIVKKDHLLEHLNYLKRLREIVISAIADGKGPEEIDVPEFYEAAEDWQIPEALKHLHRYYSAKPT